MAIYWLFCVFLQSGFTTGMPREEPTRKVHEKPAPHHHKKRPTVSKAASLDMTPLLNLSDSQSSLVIWLNSRLNYHRNCTSFMDSCSMMHDA
ncbi:hypothetical protein EDB92DRAFT_1922958 [Lactarius akahatsu]|uniref:Secreted protein n=1 Tax=Lactarius akahatsu TaxID=416441 RepID=A0AAD4Q211_9AGAM|nr:hypothetical protein EDB92DRAFT_1922958 [Lactarius akahatsu]